VVLRPTRHEISHLGDVSTSQSLGLVWKKLNLTQRLNKNPLLNKRWWIPTGARLKGPKLEPEGPRVEMWFPTADQRFSGIQCTLFWFL